MAYSRKIQLKEVCPRDGFQMEKPFIPTKEKIEIINLLSRCGYSEIQYTAFVSPKAVPNLRDAEEVSSKIDSVSGVKYIGLAANLRGL